ncbi:hypothetical protein BgiBS90_023249, partial [Biomphalaria glabrata]
RTGRDPRANCLLTAWIATCQLTHAHAQSDSAEIHLVSESIAVLPRENIISRFSVF